MEWKLLDGYILQSVHLQRHCFIITNLCKNTAENHPVVNMLNTYERYVTQLHYSCSIARYSAEFSVCF